jgi:cleavage and polyadenylation specificity factor subunit 3
VTSSAFGITQLKLRMTVDANSFSAHADFPQTSQFVEALAPPHVVLVHGEATEMARLKKALEQQATLANQARCIWNPRVTQAVRIRHQAQYIAKVGFLVS